MPFLQGSIGYANPSGRGGRGGDRAKRQQLAGGLGRLARSPAQLSILLLLLLLLLELFFIDLRILRCQGVEGFSDLIGEPARAMGSRGWTAAALTRARKERLPQPAQRGDHPSCLWAALCLPPSLPKHASAHTHTEKFGAGERGGGGRRDQTHSPKQPVPC